MPAGTRPAVRRGARGGRELYRRVGKRAGHSAAGRAARSRLDELLPSGAAPAPPSAAADADPRYGRPATPSWRDVDWSRQIHDVPVLGRSVRYADIGDPDAPPVVFVHGLGGNWQNWLENMPCVAECRRALALDLPGFGASEMPRGEVSISGYAEVVDAWLDRLGVGPAAVVGNSMGGFISAELTIRFPERVERLVLASAAGISQTHLKRRPTLTVARIAAALGALTVSRSRDVIARERLRHLVVSPVIRHPTLIAGDLLWEILQGSGKPAYLDALEALLEYDFRDRLGEIEVPVLIVWGRDDVIIPVKDSREYEQLIPNSRRVVMGDTGHVPMLERPDAFNGHLMEFLLKRPGRAPSSARVLGAGFDGDGAGRDGTAPRLPAESDGAGRAEPEGAPGRTARKAAAQ